MVETTIKGQNIDTTDTNLFVSTSSGGGVSAAGKIPLLDSIGKIGSNYVPGQTIGVTIATATDLAQVSYDTQMEEADTTRSKIKSIKVLVSGSMRVYFEMAMQQNIVTVYGRIYKNGTPVGTSRSNSTTSFIGYTEDLQFDAGDTIELRGYRQTGNYAGLFKNFRVSFNVSLVTTFGQVL